MFTLDINKWIKVMMSDVRMASTVLLLFQPESSNVQDFEQS